MKLVAKKLLTKLRGFLIEPILQQLEHTRRQKTPGVNKGTQIVLSLKYKELKELKCSLPTFDEVGFRLYSQNDEDGILLYIFSLIGTTNKKCVEICAGDGIECNTANLIINHGWIGLLFDGDEKRIQRGKAFYSQCRDTYNYPPSLTHAWITAENVNSLIANQGFTGELDLLSIDLDGIDYWVWKAIECINPRVVVTEYNDILGPDKALTIPYRPDFRIEEYDVNKGIHPSYCGASLPAFVKLAKEKGYRLVGCNRYGFNAFFVQDGIGEELLPEVSIHSCFNHPKTQFGIKQRFPSVANFDWVQV